MEFTVKDYKNYNKEEIEHLYESVGWSAYLKAPDVLRRGFENSLLTIGAYSGDKLIGIIRAVGDGETIVYIQDLLVLPEFWRMGVGKALMTEVLKRYSCVRQIVLMADDLEQIRAFYKSSAFSEMSEMGCVGFVRFGK